MIFTACYTCKGNDFCGFVGNTDPSNEHGKFD